jgi:hypothetical protein
MATALQPQFMTCIPPRDEWERLPWLFDEPGRAARKPSGWVLAALILLATADALGSDAAGRMSVGSAWQIPTVSPDALGPLSAAETAQLAEQISTAGQIGWQRRRSNAPY